MLLSCSDRILNLTTPHVMGILNVTPDSCYDGGWYTDVDTAIRRASIMCEEGASIIDIGGESTRPGAKIVPLQQELDRVMPVLEKLVDTIPAILSVDTRNTSVMIEAINRGAHMINDVAALRDEGAVDAIANSDVAVCLMHMQGTPQTMQDNPQYDDVIKDILGFLDERVDACVSAGIARDRIIVDPGFCFGKTVEHNKTILNELEAFCSLNLPVLFGASRKSFIGMVYDASIEDRLAGGLELARMALERGAKIIRTHDVKETVEVITKYEAVKIG